MNVNDQTWVQINDDFNSLLSLETPIYMDEHAYKEYICWTAEHTQFNEQNTIVERFSQQPDHAKVQRSLLIAGRLRDELTALKGEQSDATNLSFYAALHTRSAFRDVKFYGEVLSIEEKQCLLLSDREEFVKP